MCAGTTEYCISLSATDKHEKAKVATVLWAEAGERGRGKK